MANIDGRLCKRVADGLGLEPPKPTVSYDQEPVSPSLSQLGGSWPVAGRQVGIIVGEAVSESSVRTVQKSALAAGVVSLIVGPHGGKIGKLVVNRTYANAGSIEFDALVLVGDLPPAPDAMASGDAKAGTGSPSASDPRVAKLIGEIWRHSKAIAAIARTGSDSVALTDAGINGDDEGVVVGTAQEVVPVLLELLAKHRVWTRFATSADV